MSEGTKETVIKQGYETIILNISEADYPRFLSDISYTRQVIDVALAGDRHQKIFPRGTREAGYRFKDFERESNGWILEEIAWWNNDILCK